MHFCVDCIKHFYVRISYILEEDSHRAVEEWKRCYRLFLLTRVLAYTSQTSVNNLETRYNSRHHSLKSPHLITIAYLNVIIIMCSLLLVGCDKSSPR